LEIIALAFLNHEVFIFEIFYELFRFALEFLGLDVDDGALLVVELAVGPNLKDVGEDVFVSFVLICL
jgi:hypothetical protein